VSVPEHLEEYRSLLADKRGLVSGSTGNGAGQNIEEQMRLLAELEATGATLYEAWAEQLGDDEAHQQLLNTASRDTLNAQALHEILQSRETSA